MAKHFGPQIHPDFTRRQMKQVKFRLPEEEDQLFKKALAHKGLNMQQFFELKVAELIKEAE